MTTACTVKGYFADFIFKEQEEEGVFAERGREA